MQQEQILNINFVDFGLNGLIKRELEEIKWSCIEVAEKCQERRLEFERLLRDLLQGLSETEVDYIYDKVYDSFQLISESNRTVSVEESDDLEGKELEGEERRRIELEDMRIELEGLRGEVKYLVDNKDRPKCQYTYARGPMRGEKCGRPVADSDNPDDPTGRFCKFCMPKKTVLA